MTEQEIIDNREYLRSWFLAIRKGRSIDNAYDWLRNYIS